MTRFNRALLAVALSSSLLVNFSSQAEEQALPDFASQQLEPGIYMLSGVGGFTGGNIALSIGEDGVIMIDDSMPPLLDKMQAAINTITKQPLDFLINTHVHGDHTGNNLALGKTGAHIVGHQNLRDHLLAKGYQTPQGLVAAPKQALPVITFKDSMDFHLNGQPAHLFHLAKAHTSGDIAIHFTQANIIHAGDVFFNGLFPYIDQEAGGSLDGYIQAQQTLIDLADDKTRIIPGHGPLASRQDLQNASNMLRAAKQKIAALVEQGKSEAEVVAINPLAEYHEQWNWGFISTEIMTRQVYRALTDKQNSVAEHSH